MAVHVNVVLFLFYFILIYYFPHDPVKLYEFLQ